MDDKPLTHDDELIQERREKVNFMLMKGATEVAIAKQLNVSEKTIQRDVGFLKEQAGLWINDLAKDGAVYECKMVLEKLKDSERELNIMLQKDKLPMETRQKLLKQRDENVTLQAQFVLEGPTLFAMKKGMAEMRFENEI